MQACGFGLGLAFDRAAAPMHVIDESGRVVTLNGSARAYFRSLGLEDPTAVSLTDLITPEDRPAYLRQLAELLTGSCESFVSEMRVRYGDRLQQERHYCSLTGAPESGVCVLTTVVPLRDSKQTVLDSLPFGVSVISRSGEPVYANPAARQIWGDATPPHDGSSAPGLCGDAPAQSVMGTVAAPLGQTAEERMVEISGRDGTRIIALETIALTAADGSPDRTIIVSSDVTERCRSEASLRRSERLSRATLEQAAVGMARVSPEGVWLEVNRRLCEIVGYSQEELLGRTFGEITHPDDLEADWTQAHQVLRGERESYSQEKRYIRKNGTPVWINLTVSLVRDEAGRPEYMIAVVEDISGRREAQESLSRANRLLDAHLNNTPLVIMEFTPDWVISRWSDEGQRLFGWTAEEVLGKHVGSIPFLPEEDRPRSERVMEQLVSGELTKTLFANANLTRDGRTLEMEWYSSAIRDEEGRLQSVLAFGLDVTARNQGIRRYQVLNDVVPVITWAARPDGQRSYVNRRFMDVTGIPAERALGWGWLDALAPEFRADFDAWWAEVSRKGEPFSVEYRVRRASDGMYRWHLGRGVPVKDESGRVLEWIGSATDIHDRKEAEQTLVGARESLEATIQQRTAELSRTVESLRSEAAERSRAESEIKRSLEEKEVLLKEIHHRVKNNLQVISSLLHMQASAAPDANTRELLHESECRVLSMALIHEHLYRSDDLSRIALHNYIAQVVSNLENSWRSEGSRVVCRVQHGSPVAVAVDKAIPCGLIVNELVTNALKHAFAAGATGTVSVRVEAQEGRITVAVSDDGMGLPEGFRYEQAKSLGLQIVRTLVRQLRGELAIESGSGTTFRLRFTP